MLLPWIGRRSRFEFRCQSKTNFNQLVPFYFIVRQTKADTPYAIWPSIWLWHSWVAIIWNRATYTPFLVRLLNELNIWNHKLTIYIYLKRSDFVASFIKKNLTFAGSLQYAKGKEEWTRRRKNNNSDTYMGYCNV